MVAVCEIAEADFVAFKSEMEKIEWPVVFSWNRDREVWLSHPTVRTPKHIRESRHAQCLFPVLKRIVECLETVEGHNHPMFEVCDEGVWKHERRYPDAHMCEFRFT